MKLLTRVLMWLIAVPVVATALLLFGARFADGPLAVVAGGPLSSGELVSGAEPNWKFAREIPTIELQLLDPPRSRTTWILEHEGRVFIPCGYMDTTWGRIWKQWPIEAEKNGAAMIRVGGKRYERRLLRVQDPDLAEPLVAELNRKYGAGASLATVQNNSLWLFELAPRS